MESQRAIKREQDGLALSVCTCQESGVMESGSRWVFPVDLTHKDTCRLGEGVRSCVMIRDDVHPINKMAFCLPHRELLAR